MGIPFQTLGIDDIARINREAIAINGGLFVEAEGNFHNRGSLEHIIEAVIFPLFGQDAYPGTFRKIAAIVRTITVSHVFHDGNKRTAMATLLGLLEMNGYSIAVDHTTADFLIEVAASSMSLDQVEAWITQHAKPLAKGGVPCSE